MQTFVEGSAAAQRLKKTVLSLFVFIMKNIKTSK